MCFCLYDKLRKPQLLKFPKTTCILMLCGVLLMAIHPQDIQSEEIRSWQISAPYTLAEDVVAQDVTCNHSSLTIQAEVTGQVFAVGCELTLGQNSLLHHGVTFSGGKLQVEEYADVFGDITQIGGKLWVAPNANLHGIIHRYRSSEETPPEVQNVSQRYLTFRRMIPNDIEHFDRAIQELNLTYSPLKERDSLASFEIQNFLDFRFKQDQVQFAQKIIYEKKSGFPIELQVIQFESEEQAFWFWRNILSFTNLNLSRSVQNSLGDGGHWFFRFQNRSSLLWHRRTWVFSAQVITPKNEADDFLWVESENQRDEWIRYFQKSLSENAGKIELGDRFIGNTISLEK